MNGLPYYKAYPRDFMDGTIGMSFELKGAYRLVLDLIYMQAGRLPDEAKYIAANLGCSVRAWNKYRAELISAGKITIENDFISNFRATLELEKLEIFQDKQRENAAKPRKNNSLPLAMAKPKPSHTEADTDTEKKEQQQREETAKQDQTTRERLLTAMGADPRSGMIGPNGRRLGTVADTTEAERWATMGLTVEKQCAVIAERCAAMRRTNPNWTPGRFSYFAGAMQDLIAANSNTRGTVAPQDDMAKKMERWKRLGAAK